MAVDFYDFNNPKDIKSLAVKKDLYYSDFTFNMPYMDGEKLIAPLSNETLVNEYNQDYKPSLNSKETIQEIVNNFKKLTQYSTTIRIQTITDADLDN